MAAGSSWLLTLPPVTGTTSLQQQTMMRPAGCSQRQTASRTRAVQTLGQLSADLESSIDATFGNCLVQSDLQLGRQTVGKVRDMYSLDEHLLIVTTDRQSAFDRLLASVPYKGQVLNQTSCWWMHQTRHIVPNALTAEPHPNAVIMQQCKVFPVEFVVRGFITGSTSTSLWTHYKSGSRSYCGNEFPDGLRKNDRLQENVITPTTKAADHDEPISPQDIVGQGLMSQEDVDQTFEAALGLFNFGQEEAKKRDLLLVDTKYEFGKAPDGTIRLVDEIHTPDSSRYWLASSYEQRHALHEEPESIDKEFLRLWFRDNCDPYHDKVLPEAPKELVVELARRYITLYQMITGKTFEASPVTADTNAEIRSSIVKHLGL
ncbi:hypothetical protein WJX84_002294 [Apatococcus fuscideae]|uniref:phosphoribosylaminoimidazolesuccinocarboxamide synthase n=1 Tax=Apatococcus fuscideae TaxID=2026836 RepID=A0AAW1STT7_9CHLO